MSRMFMALACACERFYRQFFGGQLLIMGLLLLMGGSEALLYPFVIGGAILYAIQVQRVSLMLPWELPGMQVMRLTRACVVGIVIGGGLLFCICLLGGTDYYLDQQEKQTIERMNER